MLRNSFEISSIWLSYKWSYSRQEMFGFFCERDFILLLLKYSILSLSKLKNSFGISSIWLFYKESFSRQFMFGLFTGSVLILFLFNLSILSLSKLKNLFGISSILFRDKLSDISWLLYIFYGNLRIEL